MAALGLDSDGLESVAHDIRAAGGDAIAIVADISRPEAMEDAYRRVDEQWGRLDIVFAKCRDQRSVGAPREPRPR